jgi:hypothetical protein
MSTADAHAAARSFGLKKTDPEDDLRVRVRIMAKAPQFTVQVSPRSINFFKSPAPSFATASVSCLLTAPS